jgi:hypothetical protein
MPGIDGYQTWDGSVLRALVLNGAPLLDSAGSIPSSWSPDSPGTILATMDGGAILQLQTPGGDCPVMFSALKVSITMQHNREEDYRRMCVAERFPPVRWWMELPLPCIWYIPGKNTGQTAWQIDRRLPYGGAVPGVTHATHPPRAEVDGVAQTIITTGTPTTGQVLVPESAGFASIVTPATLTGELLVLWVPFELLVKISGPSTNNPQANLLAYSATLEEVQGSGDYTEATE